MARYGPSFFFFFNYLFVSVAALNLVGLYFFSSLLTFLVLMAIFFVPAAASDILLRQKCAKILVGDPHQQIYAFRGARNALQEVPSTHTFYLTQVSDEQFNLEN